MTACKKEVKQNSRNNILFSINNFGRKESNNCNIINKCVTYV